MSDKDLEELRDATTTGTRAEDTAPEQDFVDMLAGTLEEIEGNRGSRVVTANAPDLWALLATLDNDQERRKEFLENVALPVPDDDKDMNRSAVLKRLVRIGLEETDPELVEAVKEAKDKTSNDIW